MRFIVYFDIIFALKTVYYFCKNNESIAMRFLGVPETYSQTCFEKVAQICLCVYLDIFFVLKILFRI